MSSLEGGKEAGVRDGRAFQRCTPGGVDEFVRWGGSTGNVMAAKRRIWVIARSYTTSHPKCLDHWNKVLSIKWCCSHEACHDKMAARPIWLGVLPHSLRAKQFSSNYHELRLWM